MNMSQHDADYLPLFLLRCVVAVRNFLSVFFVVPNIWFGVDGNSGNTNKSNLYM